METTEKEGRLAKSYNKKPAVYYSFHPSPPLPLPFSYCNKLAFISMAHPNSILCRK
jgi:hypothetical protein